MAQENKTQPQSITMKDISSVYDSSEKLAKEIRMLSRGFKRLVYSGLKKETIVVLLHESSNVGKPDIRAILVALENMEKNYTNAEGK